MHLTKIVRLTKRSKVVTLKFLILPGIGNSDENHWQTLWENKSRDFQRIQQADWNNPDCSEWQNNLEEAVVALGKNTFLIAHSLSCLLVSHWASRSNLSNAGALLVAPPDPNAAVFPKEAVRFSDFPSKKFAFPSIVVSSENDPYAEIDFSRNCASLWGAEFVSIGKCGHINSSSGFGFWPQGELLLERLVKKVYA